MIALTAYCRSILQEFVVSEACVASCRGNSSAAEIEQPELHFQVSQIDLVVDADGNGLRPLLAKEQSQQGSIGKRRIFELQASRGKGNKASEFVT